VLQSSIRIPSPEIIKRFFFYFQMLYIQGGGRGVAKIWAKMGWDNWEFDCDILQKEVTGLYIFYWPFYFYWSL
jgi:hypothetical protein